MKVTDAMLESLKSLQIDVDAATRGNDTELAAELLRRERKMQERIRAAFAAVAPDPAPDDAESLPTNGPSLPTNAASLPTNAPDDAEFEAALNEMVTAEIGLSGAIYNGAHRTVVETCEQTLISAQQRIHALHRQAKHAGYVAALTEVRAWAYAKYLDASAFTAEAEAYRLTMEQIESMMKEATDGR